MQALIITTVLSAAILTVLLQYGADEVADKFMDAHPEFSGKLSHVRLRLAYEPLNWLITICPIVNVLAVIYTILIYDDLLDGAYESIENAYIRGLFPAE